MEIKQKVLCENSSILNANNMITRLFNGLTMLFILTTVACSSVTPQTTQSLQAAQSAIDNADQQRVSDYAQPELAQARAKLTAARAALQQDDIRLANYLAEESRVSAELASAKVVEIKARKINQDMINSIDTLKQEMQRNNGGML